MFRFSSILSFFLIFATLFCCFSVPVFADESVKDVVEFGDYLASTLGGTSTVEAGGVLNKQSEGITFSGCSASDDGNHFFVPNVDPGPQLFGVTELYCMYCGISYFLYKDSLDADSSSSDFSDAYSDYVSTMPQGFISSNPSFDAVTYADGNIYTYWTPSDGDIESCWIDVMKNSYSIYFSNQYGNGVYPLARTLYNSSTGAEVGSVYIGYGKFGNSLSGYRVGFGIIINAPMVGSYYGAQAPTGVYSGNAMSITGYSTSKVSISSVDDDAAWTVHPNSANMSYYEGGHVLTSIYYSYTGTTPGTGSYTLPWWRIMYATDYTEEEFNAFYEKPTRITNYNLNLAVTDGDNNIVGLYNDVQIINEDNSTLYNPVTNEYYDIDYWQYDYGDRDIHGSLNIENDTDVNFDVTFGDEDVTLRIGDIEYILKYILSCDHDYVLSSSTAPSCTDFGTNYYTCSKCGDTYTVTVNALGHNYEMVGSYTETTETAYNWTCPLCDWDWYDSTGEYMSVHDHDLIIDLYDHDESLSCNGCGEEFDIEGFTEVSVDVAGYDLYRCTRCGDEYKDYTYINDDSDDSNYWAWLKNWLISFKMWLGEKFDDLTGTISNTTNSSDESNTYNDYSITDNSDIVTTIYDYEITYVTEGGDDDTFSMRKLINKFKWVKDVYKIGKELVSVVSSDAAAAYELDIASLSDDDEIIISLDGDAEEITVDTDETDPAFDGSGIMVDGAPYIPINLAAAKSHYGFDYGGEVGVLDLSWYAPYKKTVDNILGGFLWVFFMWKLFQRAPGIIGGAGMDSSKVEDIQEGERHRRR